jgi:glycosyltransferase involved in cell wall biosynthesis
MFGNTYVRKCDAVVAVSEEDCRNLKRVARFDKIYTIANGVDTEFFKASENVAKQPGQVIFSGSLGWPPNQKAVVWFLKKCWQRIIERRPNTRFKIIGKTAPRDLLEFLKGYRNVNVRGYVDDVRTHINESMVSIAPMVSGSGIKNKILEAWALEQAVVSTPLGCQSLMCEHNTNILVGRSAKEFSAHVLELLEDSDLRERLGRAGRENVLEFYTWNKAASRLLQIFRIVGNGR